MNDGSLHTDRSVPLRVHWKRMVLLLFYFLFYILYLKINDIKTFIFSQKGVKGEDPIQ